ncbi:restriction endonuclease subunit S [bacterium 19MO02SH05]|uniref:Restriction endonuclease subunit S n=1 Tax=bacterium 19MO02SH05 TaxID=2920696 RepID=A0AAU6TIG7_UNCXX
MRSNYKKLGQFIKEVSVKNKDLSVELLLGVSITKQFIPSIANTVGTDMSKYKVVEHHQFAYGPVTSRNGEKISVALLSEEKCIVSTSYTVFEIVDTERLDPEYLMMWFKRSEFDRYARYMSHGTVRELFGWQEMCDVELPVPSIDKQREIVREYNVVSNRIVLNEQLTQKLEDITQAIYKQWFVDFEFPISKEYAESIGKPELEGKLYKSSGGEIRYCEALEKDMPKGWNFTLLKEITTNVDNRGKTPPHTKHKTEFPLLEIGSLKSDGRTPDYSKCSKYLSHETYESWFRSGHPKAKDTLFSTVGSLAQMKLFWGEKGSIAQNIVGFRCNDDIGLYIYQYLKNSIEKLLAYEIGSVQASIKVSHLADFKVLLPNSDNQLLTYFEKISECITEYSFQLNMQRDLLAKLQDMLLQKMSKD